MMKRSLPVILILVLATTLPAAAADVKVIANPSVLVSQISPAELKRIFLVTKTSLSDGSHVEPVILRSGDTLEVFVKQYIGKTATGLENYYRSLVFTGKGTMPKMFKSEAAVLDYVRKTKGAIGYVSAEGNTEGVKLLDLR